MNYVQTILMLLIFKYPKYSWFEKSKKFQAHYPHHHGPTGYSCVLYIFYDKEEHTPTTFMNPYLISSIGGQSDWSFENAQEGSLLCWIHHQ